MKPIAWQTEMKTGAIFMGDLIKQGDFIKQDINFLENPIWFQDELLANKNENGYVWKDVSKGYIYRAGYKPTVKQDNIFLTYLLLKSQQNGWVDKLETTRFEILRGCNLTPSKDKYKRLEDSLKRWEHVKIEFKGTFYDAKAYETLHFGIIDSWGIDENNKKLYIRFSPEWLLCIKSSNFFKMIEFNTLKILKTPLVIRLYEILVKSFQGRSEWQINALKLAQKIPLNRKYASEIRIKVEPAIQRINVQTSLKVTMETVKKERGNLLFIFRKESKSESNGVDFVELNQNEVNQDKAKNISANITKYESDIEVKLRQIKVSKKQIDEIIKKYPIDRILRNFELTQKNLLNGDIRNSAAFFIAATKDDYAKVKTVDPKISELIREATGCWKKHKGGCGAIWSDYQNDKSRACYFCLKFKNQRDTVEH